MCVRTKPPLGPAFYAVMTVLFLVLFVMNVCATDGTTLGLISDGGIAVLTGYLCYQAWVGKRQTNRQFPPRQ